MTNTVNVKEGGSMKEMLCVDNVITSVLFVLLLLPPVDHVLMLPTESKPKIVDA